MARETMRETCGFIMGYRDDQGDKIRAESWNYKFLGEYDKASNETRRWNGVLYCTGDGTSALIIEDYVNNNPESGLGIKRGPNGRIA